MLTLTVQGVLNRVDDALPEITSTTLHLDLLQSACPGDWCFLGEGCYRFGYLFEGFGLKFVVKIPKTFDGHFHNMVEYERWQDANRRVYMGKRNKDGTYKYGRAQPKLAALLARVFGISKRHVVLGMEFLPDPIPYSKKDGFRNAMRKVGLRVSDTHDNNIRCINGKRIRLTDYAGRECLITTVLTSERS